MSKILESPAPTENGQPIIETPKERFNIVKTVLSQEAVQDLEHLLYWFWNETEWERFTEIIMEILSVYVAHCPKNAHQFMQPEWITSEFISPLIQLNERLVEIMNVEKPFDWEDGDYGLDLLKNENELENKRTV